MSEQVQSSNPSILTRVFNAGATQLSAAGKGAAAGVAVGVVAGSVAPVTKKAIRAELVDHFQKTVPGLNDSLANLGKINNDIAIAEFIGKNVKDNCDEKTLETVYNVLLNNGLCEPLKEGDKLTKEFIESAAKPLMDNLQANKNASSVLSKNLSEQINGLVNGAIDGYNAIKKTAYKSLEDAQKSVYDLYKGAKKAAKSTNFNKILGASVGIGAFASMVYTMLKPALGSTRQAAGGGAQGIMEEKSRLSTHQG